jgi:hypothetical protein
VIEEYLERNPALSPEMRDYALAASRFEVM